MNMQQTIRALLYFNGMAQHFDDPQNDDLNFHLKIHREPWMPLVIERHGDEVCIMHYFIQEGDLIRDPEVVFSLHDIGAYLNTPGWQVKSIEQGFFGLKELAWFQRNEQDELRLHRHPREQADAARFANGLWARNLKAQNFVQRHKPEHITSLTHPDALQQVLAQTRVMIPITKHPFTANDGTTSVLYKIPDDLPRSLWRGGYEDALAALQADYREAQGKYAVAVSGEGYRITLKEMEPCECEYEWSVKLT
jgi:hypothetical protein